MSIVDFLLGRPLATSEESSQRIGPARGIPTFGLDALSSAAYGPEAALTILRPLGLLGLAFILPLSAAIVALLAIVYFSYRQTIAAYPTGGGSYTVAGENLGERAALLAAAALMIDYLLNVAVGISAGVGALVSALPSLQPHTLAICLGILAALTVMNLRGTREAGMAFLAPTVAFVGCLLVVIGWGAVKSIMAGGHPTPAVPPPPLPVPREAVGAWLLLKAFASGCTAMTGIEAVSNGVQAFRKPVVGNARKTLGVIVAILIVLLIGIAHLARVYHVGATPPGQQGYRSVLAMLTSAVAGEGVFYYGTVGAVLIVLCLSANTSFAGFPRLCHAVAINGYLPQSFVGRGRRLVYSEGIWVLAILAAALLVLFGGVTDRLIPLFAVGAFLAFTLSQAGMVAHWRRKRGRGAFRSMLVNGLGAGATGITVLIVLAAKFVDGAWVVVLLVPALVLLMLAVRRHYDAVERATRPARDFLHKDARPPLVVVPIERWSSVVQQALSFALTLSKDVQIVHVECEGTDALPSDWPKQIERQARAAGLPVPKSVALPSPYRTVVRPIVEYVLDLERRSPGRRVAVVIPALVERRWYHYFLHNQHAELLSALLLVTGERRIVIIDVPWYLPDRRQR